MRGLAVYMKAPHSYTGEDVVEIQIHGSMEALRETLELALENGAVLASRGEFTKRAFLNGRLDLSQAEAVMDIIEAKGSAALSQAESHLSGALSRFVKKSRDELTDLITKLEVTIDYPEEDLEDLTNEEIAEGLTTIEKSLSSLLKRSEEGRIIKEGLRTAIVGRPNAGNPAYSMRFSRKTGPLSPIFPAPPGIPSKNPSKSAAFPWYSWIPPASGRQTTR